MTTETKGITEEQARRILGMVGSADASPAKLKTAFLSVVQQDMKAAGVGMDELRSALDDVTSAPGGDTADETPSEPAAQKPLSKSARRKLADAASTQAKPAAKPAAKQAATQAKASKPAAQPKAEKPKREPKVVETDPKKVLAALKASHPQGDRVLEVLEVSERGKPLRVRILCDDPATGQRLPNKKDGSNCRDIKVQDLFQVRFTVEGSKEARKLARRKTPAA